MTQMEPGPAGPGQVTPPPLAPGSPPSGFASISRSGSSGAGPAHARPPVTVIAGPFLDSPGVPPTTRDQAWRWVLYAAAGFLIGQVAASIFGVAAGAIAGKSSAQLTVIARSTQPPEWYVLSTLLGIWLGYVGAPWLASRTAGTKHFLRDIGLRFRPIDAVLGVIIGVASQFGVDLLYAPFQHDISGYNAPTQKLIGASHGGGGVFLIVLASVVLAPCAEELCFRGVLLKGLVRLGAPPTLGPSTRRNVRVAVAIVLDGLLFGLAHGEWVQLAGLALFGVVLATMSYRTGRLGMNMVAHGSFNLIAVIAFYHWY
ncbi:MAG TPA: CPBP family intramembrane glutamic endopeptidase [Acidimicrobiales bacterium]